MNDDHALELITGALKVAAAVGGPLLLASLVVGIVVGVLQAATQVNEASVTYVVKACAVLAVLLALGHVLASEMVGYTRESFQSIGHVVR